MARSPQVALKLAASSRELSPTDLLVLLPAEVAVNRISHDNKQQSAV